MKNNRSNLENTTKYGFSPDLGEKDGGVLSKRMQVILDSSFTRPGSAPIWGGKKGEFRDWTKKNDRCINGMFVFTILVHVVNRISKSARENCVNLTILS